MEKSLHYYAIAEQCEREAAEASHEQTREIMLEAAAQWRRLGDEAKSDEIKKLGGA
jgi:hypothetical protein